MKKSWLLRGVSVVHLYLFFVWTAILKSLGVGRLDLSAYRGVLSLFVLVSIIHLVCAVYVLYARFFALMMTIVFSVIYLGVQVKYGYTLQDIIIAALLIFNGVVSLWYLGQKKSDVPK